MKISIIIPFYNVEKYFEKCIKSALSQSVPAGVDYDIYLIDDRGNDGSLDIARSFAEKYPEKIRLLQNDINMGQGRSRMRAVEQSDADYILFVDSDDYIAPDYIERFVTENDKCYDLIIAGFTKDIDGKYSKFNIKDSPYTILLYSVACCKMYKREFLIKNHIDFSDIRKGEDIYFSLAIFYSRPKYKVINYHGYYYRLNQTSTTRSMNYNNNFEEIVIDIFSKFRANFDGSKMNKKMKRLVEYSYVANVVNALVVYGHGAGTSKMKEKLIRVEEDIIDNYPDIMKNRNLRFFRPRVVSLKIRSGVGAFYWSRKFRLYKPMFMIISKM